MMENVNKELAEVFKDANTHQLVASIIIKHLSNKKDVRETALDGIDLRNARKILDLGCGFGFFTESLKGKVDPSCSIKGIDKHNQYEKYYLNACKNAGIKGTFTDEGIQSIEKIKDNTYDVIICSYALYFFPEYIHHISRILKKDGYFITITHSQPHMNEFTTHIRQILRKHNIKFQKSLPYEDLINNFSNQNGDQLLSPWFDDIKSTYYQNTLTFEDEDYYDFSTYFCFKKSFFLPIDMYDEKELCKLVLEEINKDFSKNKSLSITKDDMIFVCKGK